MINFYCDECKRPVNYDKPQLRCQCPDIEERYYRRFWGSTLWGMAREAVKKVRGDSP
jgi:hypothetical protein